MSFVKKNYRWKRTRQSHRNCQDPAAKALAKSQLIQIEALAAAGQIALKYPDETGCCQWTPESYSYSQVSEQKRFEQTSRCGQRVSILGVWDPDESSDYALCFGGFNGEHYLEMMNWLAAKAAKNYADNQQLTFVVQDNCSIHISKPVQQHWPQWQAQGLFVLFLPPNCSELNPIKGRLWNDMVSAVNKALVPPAMQLVSPKTIQK
ncbi:MAG: transposase [Cyanobacteria bacterium J06581_3]